MKWHGLACSLLLVLLGGPVNVTFCLAVCPGLGGAVALAAHHGEADRDRTPSCHDEAPVSGPGLSGLPDGGCVQHLATPQESVAALLAGRADLRAFDMSAGTVVAAAAVVPLDSLRVPPAVQWRTAIAPPPRPSLVLRI